MSQNSRIWNYLASGRTLTPIQAFKRFGVLCMHSRASELRDRGHDVRCVMVRVGDKRVGLYSMKARRI